MRVVVVVATQPVLEGGVGDLSHQDGNGVFVASDLDELLHASLVAPSPSCRRAPWHAVEQLVVEADGGHFVLVEVQDVLASGCP
eukprot:6214091-Pleurochrysis_carterae.AAC.1